MPTTSIGGIELHLPSPLLAAVERDLERWDAEHGTARLWRRDASLWTGGDEARWLGWLEPGAGTDLDELGRFGAEVAARGVRSVVLIGMGGSSLGAEVVARAVRRPGAPELLVLDTTDPDEIRAVDAGLDHARTLFIVASKSGTTIESVSLEEYFRHRLDQEGLLRPEVSAQAPSAFVAITDPGTPLEARARERGYRLFRGVPDIGGRFSALSPFGLVPAAAVGGDVEAVLRSARAAAAAAGAALGAADLAASRDSGHETPAAENPGIAFGVVLATLAREGRDKLTLFPPPELELLGPWLEQLVAESTGKHGTGILPVAGEERLSPDAYGADRVMVEWAGAPDGAAIGVPTLRLPSIGPGEIGGEIFRWELATAVIGSRLGIDPFDQPDVDAAKAAAKRLVAAALRGQVEPRGERLHVAREWRWHGASPALRAARAPGPPPRDLLRAHLDTLAAGDFFALLAYLPRGGEVASLLSRMRGLVAARRRVATTLGFGPRYLHSTGQYFKGGPNRGVYLFVTRRVEDDLAIPGQELGFGALEAAQAQGDVEVLLERGRRVLQVELLEELVPGLERLARLFEEVCS